MSAPRHHLDDEVLLDYVTGATIEPVALVVACHLTFCSACRARASAAEAVGGAVLEAAVPAPLSTPLWDRVQDLLDGDRPPPIRTVTGDEAAGDEAAGDEAAGDEADRPLIVGGVLLPRPLAPYLRGVHGGGGSNAPGGAAASSPRRQLRFLAPGIRGIDLPVTAPRSVRTRLLRLAAGMEIPRHTHGGAEHTLVLAGGLTDGQERFERGDVRCRPASDVHTQKVDPDGPCLALVVNEGALIPRTWRGKVVSFLFDRG